MFQKRNATSKNEVGEATAANKKEKYGNIICFL